ncbi:hypothetical protein HN51_048639 [Arachis hypogaea]
MAINTFSKLFFCILFVNVLLMTSEARSGNKQVWCEINKNCNQAACANYCATQNFQQGQCATSSPQLPNKPQCCCTYYPPFNN